MTAQADLFNHEYGAGKPWTDQEWLSAVRAGGAVVVPRAADQPMGEAASHADPSDLASLRLHAETLAKVGEVFSAEDVSARLSESQRDRLSAFPNATGGLYRSMKLQGLIECVGYCSARRPDARGRTLKLWRGKRLV